MTTDQRTALGVLWGTIIAVVVSVGVLVLSVAAEESGLVREDSAGWWYVAGWVLTGLVGLSMLFSHRWLRFGQGLLLGWVLVLIGFLQLLAHVLSQTS